MVSLSWLECIGQSLYGPDFGLKSDGYDKNGKTDYDIWFYGEDGFDNLTIPFIGTILIN